MAARVVMVFGTFDGLHPGHRHFFRQARRHGDTLIVVVGRDQTVKVVKGRLPRCSEQVRRRAVAAASLVSRAVFGDLKDQMKVVHTYRPSVVCLGYDQIAFVDQLYQTFPNLKIVRLRPYQPDRYKSSHFNV